jgi:hypothetical protein
VAARCQIELRAPDAASAFQDPAGALLDAVTREDGVQQERIRQILQDEGLPYQVLETDAIDTQIHDDLPVRLVVDPGRITVTFDLPKGGESELPAFLDALFDLCFSLAQGLSLEVYDPQTQGIVSQQRYERTFGRILDSYARRQRFADALGRPEDWTALPEEDVPTDVLDTEVEAPQLSIPQDVLPSRRRALRGHFGPVEITGETATRALEASLDDSGLLILVPIDRENGEALLARIVRYARLRPQEWLVELQALGRRTIVRVDSGPVRWARVSEAHRSQ